VGVDSSRRSGSLASVRETSYSTNMCSRGRDRSSGSKLRGINKGFRRRRSDREWI
jgi:hypothetical protein